MMRQALQSAVRRPSRFTSVCSRCSSSASESSKEASSVLSAPSPYRKSIADDPDLSPQRLEESVEFVTSTEGTKVGGMWVDCAPAAVIEEPPTGKWAMVAQRFNEDSSDFVGSEAYSKHEEVRGDGWSIQMNFEEPDESGVGKFYGIAPRRRGPAQEIADGVYNRQTGKIAFKEFTYFGSELEPFMRIEARLGGSGKGWYYPGGRGK